MAPVCHRLAEDVLLYLVFGDVRQTLPLMDFCHFDAWYLSGYAPKCNAEMYGKESAEQIVLKSNPHVPIVSYSVASSVIEPLQEVGVDVVKSPTQNLKKKKCLRGVLSSDTKKSQYATRKKLQKKVDDVVIIGGGIAGLSCAYAFRDAGARVTIIDNHAPNAASKIPTAQVTRGIPDLQQPLGALRFLAFDRAKRFYQEHMGESILSEGSLHVLDGFRARQAHERSGNILWHKAGARILNSDLASSLAGISIANTALYWRDSLHLDVASLFKHFASFPMIDQHVTAIKQASNHWKIFSDDELLLEAPHVIFASGNGLPDMLKNLDVVLPFCT